VSIAKGIAANKRKRITGVLELGPRRPQIVTVTGDRWSLDCDDIAPDLVGHEVTVEGILTAMNRIKADWIGVSET